MVYGGQTVMGIFFGLLMLPCQIEGDVDGIGAYLKGWGDVAVGFTEAEAKKLALFSKNCISPARVHAHGRDEKNAPRFAVLP